MSKENNEQNVEEMYNDALDMLKATPKETLKGVLFTEKPDGQVPYVVILKRIKDSELNPSNYIFYDEKHTAWVWNTECNAMESLEQDYYFGDCKSSRYLTDDYDDLELINLFLLPIPKEKEEESPKYLAKQEIIKELEQKYMDLNMELDACQGCMDGVDEAFEKLRLYKELVKYLGGDIDAHLQELTDNWFKEAKKRDEEEKAEKEKEDAVIKLLPFPALDMVLLEDEKLRNYLWASNDKINEICNILIKRLK